MTSFDPTTLGIDADPYAQLAELRKAGPVLRLPNGFWAVTGYRAAEAVLRARECASGPIAARYLAGLPAGAARDEMSHRINFLDPPDHTRVRSLVSKAFTPRRVEALVPWIDATAERLALELDDAEFDLLLRFAHQLPSLVISELLGVPVADRDRLTAWSDAVAPLLSLDPSDEQRSRAIAGSEEFHSYLGRLLERRQASGEDLLSALLAAEEDGERLSRPELLSLAATLYSAGHRTTRDLFANGMSVLLTSPRLYDDAVGGRWSPAALVAEFLRYVTPTLFVARIPMAAVRIGHVEIPAFEPILIYLAAANRDPEQFEEPDAFRPDREGPPALSFALGSHFCLGASLARAEVEAMLKAVMRRWPRMRLCPERPLRWEQRGTFRGLAALWVAVASGRTIA